MLLMAHAMETHHRMEEAVQAMDRKIFGLFSAGEDTFLVSPVYPFILLVQPELQRIDIPYSNVPSY